MEELEELTRSVCDRFGDDPSAPSVVVSHLQPVGTWYAAIVRYRARYGEDKYCVVSCYGNSAAEAIAELAGVGIASIYHYFAGKDRKSVV